MIRWKKKAKNDIGMYASSLSMGSARLFYSS